MIPKLATLAVIVTALGTVLFTDRGLATAYTQTTHQCPSVPTLNGFKRADAIRILTHDISCAEALGVIRAKESNIGVTFSGNPDNASSFRWKLYGLPGWTCYGDGSGFPGRGAGGVCAKGSATVEWYHA